MLKISQSLLKGLLSYGQKDSDECGLVFKAKYIDSRFDLFAASDAQNLGAWFEYKATGSIPKNGTIPQPEYLSKKKDSNGDPELGADYRLMLKHLPNFKNIIENYGFEIIKVGEDIKTRYIMDEETINYITNKFPNLYKLYPDLDNFLSNLEVWLTGTLDIRVKGKKDIIVKDSNGFSTVILKQGQTAILDMKVSGLLSDKWNPYGWNLSMLHDKVNLITQPIHYKFIELLNTGINPPFLFLLFAPKDENDCRIIDFRFDESHFEEHKAFIQNGIAQLLYYKKVGFKPRPSLAKCTECPLKGECEHKATVAPITVYYLQ